MSSRANNSGAGKRSNGGQTSLAGFDAGVLAEYVAKLLLASPAALELLAGEVERRLSVPDRCKVCSGRDPGGGDLQSPLSLLDDDALVPLHAAKLVSGLGKTQIYALIRKGAFPAPYKPGGVSSRWSLRELRAWRRNLE
jgi:predicted DNA-binding transcriptional regulator AlpA